MERPPWAVEPGPGQESVWDYPRPPALDEVDRLVVVELGQTLAALAEDEQVRCIVLTGAGGDFCSGADLKAAMSNPDALDRTSQKWLWAFVD